MANARDSVITPPVVIRATFWPKDSLNHSAPSGPTVMLEGELMEVGSGNSVNSCRRDPSNVVSDLLGKPQVAVGTLGDPKWSAICGRDPERPERS